MVIPQRYLFGMRIGTAARAETGSGLTQAADRGQISPPDATDHTALWSLFVVRSRPLMSARCNAVTARLAGEVAH
jgi:hypothetical protein